MRRCEIKKRYADRIKLGEEVLGMLLEYLDFSGEKIKPLSRRMNVHYNTLYLFAKGKILPFVSILLKIKSFLRKEMEEAFERKQDFN